MDRPRVDEPKVTKPFFLVDPALFSSPDARKGEGEHVTTLGALTKEIQKHKVDPALITQIIIDAATYAVTKGQTPTKEQNDQIATKAKYLIKCNDLNFEVRHAEVVSAIRELNHLTNSIFPDDHDALTSLHQSGRDFLKTYELYPPSK
jgi:hypothetical protein